MLEVGQVHSLTDFLGNYERHVQRLKETGAPEALTVDGKVELVLQNADSYEALLVRLRAIEDMDAIREGLAQADQGLGRDAAVVFAEIKAAHGL